MIFNIPHPRGFLPAGFEWRHGQPEGIPGIMVSEATAKQKIENCAGEVRRLWVYDGVTNLNEQVYNIPKGHTAVPTHESTTGKHASAGLTLTPAIRQMYKALICAAPGIPASNAKLEPGTPSSQWHANGEPDPHGDGYNGERASLCMGKLTDDELANGVYMNYDQRPDPREIIAGNAFSPIAWVTAAKERIRWLSRKLEVTRAIILKQEQDIEQLKLSKAKYQWVLDNSSNLIEATPLGIYIKLEDLTDAQKEQLMNHSGSLDDAIDSVM